jgi:hypothetical protein
MSSFFYDNLWRGRASSDAGNKQTIPSLYTFKNNRMLMVILEPRDP